MKKLAKLLTLVLALTVVMSLFAACDDPCKDGHNYVNAVCTECGDEYELIDYVSQLTFDEESGSVSEQGKIVRMYVDGDTTHFNVKKTEEYHPEGILKARYLAVNTPESTGRIEPYGKLASNYTHETLQAAMESETGGVLVESNTVDGAWETDSYGRTLAWVWYRMDENSPWRNLNLELLQLGLGYGSNPGQNRYGNLCVEAINQAVSAGLIVYSGLKDPDFFYGEAINVDLKELRTNIEQYDQARVCFEGYVTKTYDGSTYIQWYSEEDEMYYGISAYINNPNMMLQEALTVGKYIRLVGKVTNFNGWQVSDMTYNTVKDDDPNNTVVIDPPEGFEFSPMEITIDYFNSKQKVKIRDVESEDPEATTEKEFFMYDLLMDTCVTIKHLKVQSVSTTQSGNSKGAMSLRCVDDKGNKITIRTEVLQKKNESGKFVVVEASEYNGKYIDVIGLVDWFTYNGADEHQIRVISYRDITVL